MAKRRGLLQQAAKAVKQQHLAGAPAAKKQKTGHSSNPKDSKAAHNKPTPSKHPRNGHPQQQNQRPIIPFSPTDPILLVGEGDLSFAASLVTHHKCTNVTATVLEKDFAELSAKYPHVAANIAQIEKTPGCRVLYGVDARKLPAFTVKPNKSSSSSSSSPSSSGPVGAMKRIIFNFPHTGGKSTDVNRQVRYNQELLVDFFRAAQRSLAPRGAAVIVTLFEGEPYTLWNVRDLARHAGLQVETSFRFVAAAYPGYAHARTLGVVRNRRGEVSATAWKGEDRPARSYVFVRKGEGGLDLLGTEKGKKGKKRRRGGDDSESESESEGESGGEQEQEVDDEEEQENDDEEGIEGEEDDDDAAEAHAVDPESESEQREAGGDAREADQDSHQSSSSNHKLEDGPVSSEGG